MGNHHRWYFGKRVRYPQRSPRTPRNGVGAGEWRGPALQALGALERRVFDGSTTLCGMMLRRARARAQRRSVAWDIRASRRPVRPSRGSASARCQCQCRGQCACACARERLPAAMAPGSPPPAARAATAVAAPPARRQPPQSREGSEGRSEGSRRGSSEGGSEGEGSSEGEGRRRRKARRRCTSRSTRRHSDSDRHGEAKRSALQ
jgi:uncharacterized membrane protein YgcG